MIVRRSSLLLVLFALAFPTFARVISYAPYTNRVALPGDHKRMTRHFVLIESEPGNRLQNELVLYDTAESGAEPRTIYANGIVAGAALYERTPLLSPPVDFAPVILAFVHYPTAMTMVSADGGATWTEVAAVRNATAVLWSPNSDFGGPWVGGLQNYVRTGNDAWPFLVTYASRGVIAINANGQTQQVSGPGTFAVGQNRNGDRILTVELNAGNSTLTIRAHGLDGSMRNLGTIARADVTGWIADDGTTYLLIHRPEGRFLYIHRGNGFEFVRGPYDASPPQLDSPVTVGPQRDPMSFFAVPTADFAGAWMIQRDTGRPTSLSRHVISGGMQTMWSDPAGPEVEALIAGESGNTVLVQVHRDRSIIAQTPLIDPALAIWRVGDPMPREYDELYLNETEAKGFIHVNPDMALHGEPFVFDSGAIEILDEGPVSPPVGGGGDIVQEWGVVRGSLEQRLVLPGVARLRGAFDSNWLTDVTIFNPSDEAQNVAVEYVAMGDAILTGSAPRVHLRLNPHEIRFIPDALGALFHVESGGGSLTFMPDKGMNVVGRTYSRNANGGTYGFGMPAIDWYNAASARFPVTFSGAFPGDNFRTNILLTDTSGGGTSATMRAFGVSGAIGATNVAMAAPARGIFQLNNLGGALGLMGRDSGGLVVQPTRGTAIATVVAIDNRTNDPTYFPPDLPTGAATMIRTIPVIGHVDGVNGARFRSDLYLFNPNPTARTVRLEAKKWDSPIAQTVAFTLLPNESRLVPDVLQTLFQMNGLARLRYWSDNIEGGVRVTSRTYTIDATGATYGSLIPPLNNFQIAADGDALEILGVNGATGFRTNLGLVELSPPNTAPGTVDVRIRLFDQTRRQIDSFTTSVARAEGMQINDIFAARGVPQPAAAMIVVEVLNGGLIGAYATLTDNLTNDTTYLGAQLGAKPN